MPVAPGPPPVAALARKLKILFNTAMCRLFGQVSAQAGPATRFLADAERSLLRQSNFAGKDRFQKDGWGIGWYGASARSVRSAEPVFDEAPRFRRAAALARSRIVVAHIRYASNPRGLAHPRLLGIQNSQPFSHGDILFAHNGTLNIPDEVQANLGPYRRQVRGVNDSEVFFWQFVKHLELCRDVGRALEACIHETWRLWEECRGRRRDKGTPYTGLNVIVSDGSALYALCHYPYGQRPAMGLMNPRQPWGEMSWTRRGTQVVVSSENLDAGNWNRLRDRDLLTIRGEGGRLVLSKSRVEVLRHPKRSARIP